jgi:hypothetical protein
MTDLNAENVFSWEGRLRRNRKAPVTFWEEYVETDSWYKNKLVEDIPNEEMWAALEDENVSDAGEDDDSELDIEETDIEHFPSSEDDGSTTGDETDSTTSVARDTEKEEDIYRTPERKRRGKSHDGESACSTVG